MQYAGRFPIPLACLSATGGLRREDRLTTRITPRESSPSVTRSGLISRVTVRSGLSAIPPAGMPQSTILYFDEFRSTIGGTRTAAGSAGGVWASLDAPFGTTFSASNGVGLPVTRIGGAIVGKVTIVILQYGQGTGG